jgi:hypothetical protein
VGDLTWFVNLTAICGWRAKRNKKENQNGAERKRSSDVLNGISAPFFALSLLNMPEKKLLRFFLSSGDSPTFCPRLSYLNIYFGTESDRESL